MLDEGLHQLSQSIKSPHTDTQQLLLLMQDSGGKDGLLTALCTMYHPLWCEVAQLTENKTKLDHIKSKLNQKPNS